MLNDPRLSTLVTLAVAFASAIMDALTAFRVFAFDASERTAVVAVLTATAALGFFLFALLHSWNVTQAARLGLSLPQYHRKLRGR